MSISITPQNPTLAAGASAKFKVVFTEDDSFDPQRQTVVWRCDERAPKPMDDPLEAVWNSRGLPDGTYTITAVITDELEGADFLRTWRTKAEQFFQYLQEHDVAVVNPKSPKSGDKWHDIVINKQIVVTIKEGAPHVYLTQHPALALAALWEALLPGGGTTAPTTTVTLKSSYLRVSLGRDDGKTTADSALWDRIKESCDAMSYNNYERFAELALCQQPGVDDPYDKGQILAAVLDQAGKRCLPYANVELYRWLKAATEVFMMASCGTYAEGLGATKPPSTSSIANLTLPQPGTDLAGAGYLENGLLPYLALVKSRLGSSKTTLSPYEIELSSACDTYLMEKLRAPCYLELIHEYFLEESGLFQSLNAICLRYQNRRSSALKDPMVNLTLDPLRPLNNLIWGWVQDEQHRLGLNRRAYEYDAQYGIRLCGGAVRLGQTADSRKRFLEAFHSLLRVCTAYYIRSDNTTVIPDAFPVLNALKEVHLILTEGMVNQYGDLTWQARQEMLMNEWIMARPEMREFMPMRVMVGHSENWMSAVDAMNKLQDWQTISSQHFGDLANFGERILLGIRFGNWSSVSDRDSAGNWAQAFRPEVQGYIHAYATVTGVDITAGALDATQPSQLINRRQASRRAA